jgi:xylan 1,4-beta-xylosidase
VPAPDGLVLDGAGAARLHDATGVPAFVGARQRDHHETLELAVSARPGAGGAAGLVVRQSGAADLRVEVVRGLDGDGLRVRIVARETSVDREIAGATVEETGSGGVEMLLRASCRGDAYDLVALVVDPAGGPPTELLRARAEARVVSTETAGGFVGVVWGAAVDGPGQLVLHRASRTVG